MIIPISYPLTTKTPLYPNIPLPVIHTLRSIKKGDSVNTRAITFSTHSGTHIDAPFHFCNKGKTIVDCLTINTSFFPTYCIDVPKQLSEEITVSDLKQSIFTNAEALLIRTGWHTVRSENPDQYSTDHPWISPNVPKFIREKYPHLLLFGIDQISISSVLHRDAGYECHQNFLCGDKSILILEDLNLSDIRHKEAFRIHIYPHFIGDIDGVPVTVIAEIR